MSFWTHLKAEARDGAAVTFWWGQRVFLGVIAAHVILAAAYAAQSPAPAADTLRGVGAVIAAGLGQGLWWGAAAGLTALLRRLAGWGLLAPAVLVPAGVIAAFWFGNGMLDDSLHKLTAEASKRTHQARYIKDVAQIPVPMPVGPVLALPLLVTHCATSFEVFACFLFTLVVVAMLISAGAAAGTALSLPVLAVAIYRRVRRRARERNRDLHEDLDHFAPVPLSIGS